MQPFHLFDKFDRRRRLERLMPSGFWIENKGVRTRPPIETAAFRSLVAEPSFFERSPQKLRHLEGFGPLLPTVGVNIIDRGPVPHPSIKVHCPYLRRAP